jgi:predicted aconitase with swiveling domain
VGEDVTLRTLAPGEGAGPLLVLDEPLSLWGGLDPATGRLIDSHHPQVGAELAGVVLAMPGGRGSSSSSSILAEAIRARTAPVAILLGEVDPIVVLGALVAAELYGTRVPVVAADRATYDTLRTGDRVEVRAAAAGATLVVADG